MACGCGVKHNCAEVHAVDKSAGQTIPRIKNLSKGRGWGDIGMGVRFYYILLYLHFELFLSGSCLAIKRFFDKTFIHK